jgi:hypothetical protein
MSKGGFLVEMLASKRATTDMSYLWRFLYYSYIALPLLVIYFVLYLTVIGAIVSYVRRLFGVVATSASPFDLSPSGLVISLAASIGVSVALFHFGVLPYVFVPVKLLTSV